MCIRDRGLLIRSFSRALAKDFDDVYLKEVYRDAKEYAADQGYAFEDPEYIDLISFCLLYTYPSPRDS